MVAAIKLVINYKYMKKKEKFILYVVAVLILVCGVLGFIYQRNNTQAGLCQKAGNTGWAPLGPNGGPIACDGKHLSPDSSLIDRSEDFSGYTCYCHAPNTCWDGKECVLSYK